MLCLGLLFILLAAVTLSTSHGKCEEGLCTAFANHDFPLQRSFALQEGESNPQSLSLTAAGIRRKNLFIVEVDVYRVGVYLSEAKDAQLLQSSSQQPVHVTISQPVQQEVTLGIVLHFLRSVTAKQVVDAIVEALVDPQAAVDYQTALKHFQTSLLEAIGQGKGLSQAEEIVFLFHGTDRLSFSVRGQAWNSLANGPLRQRLAEIYTGPKAVATEVHQVLVKRYEA
eukprot:gene10533-11670_t